jgi:hypothetical protein
VALMRKAEKRWLAFLRWEAENRPWRPDLLG